MCSHAQTSGGGNQQEEQKCESERIYGQESLMDLCQLSSRKPCIRLTGMKMIPVPNGLMLISLCEDSLGALHIMAHLAFTLIAALLFVSDKGDTHTQGFQFWVKVRAQCKVYGQRREDRCQRVCSGSCQLQADKPAQEDRWGKAFQGHRYLPIYMTMVSGIMNPTSGLGKPQCVGIVHAVTCAVYRYPKA